MEQKVPEKVLSGGEKVCQVGDGVWPLPGAKSCPTGPQVSAACCALGAHNCPPHHCKAGLPSQGHAWSSGHANQVGPRAGGASLTCSPSNRTVWQPPRAGALCHCEGVTPTARDGMPACVQGHSQMSHRTRPTSGVRAGRRPPLAGPAGGGSPPHPPPRRGLLWGCRRQRKPRGEEGM